MKKISFAFLAMLFIPHAAFSQVMFHQPENSVYDNIPVGQRVFPLPVDIYQLKGIQAKHRVDVFATFNKKEKISALLAEMKAAQKSNTLGAIPMVFKTDADEEFTTVLLLQNIKVLYVPAISSNFALDYPEAGVEIKRSDTATISNDGGKVSIDNAEKLVSLAKKAIIRLLLTPEEVQLAAYAVATDTKFSLVIRDSNDTGTKVLQPVDIKTFTKEKKQS